MNDMRKLLETIEPLFESLHNEMAQEVQGYIGVEVQPEELDIYTDGMSYAIRYLPTDEYFLYIENEGLEDAEFNSWPPKVHAHYGTQLRHVPND